MCLHKPPPPSLWVSVALFPLSNGAEQLKVNTFGGGQSFQTNCQLFLPDVVGAVLYEPTEYVTMGTFVFVCVVRETVDVPDLHWIWILPEHRFAQPAIYRLPSWVSAPNFASLKDHNPIYVPKPTSTRYIGHFLCVACFIGRFIFSLCFHL